MSNKPSKNNEEILYPSNPSDRLKIREQINAAVALMEDIQDKRAEIKDVVDIIHTDYNMNKKTINKLIKMHYKRNKEEVVAEVEDAADAYDMILGGGVRTQDTTDLLSVGTEDD